MPRPLKFGRLKQPPENQQIDVPRTGLSSSEFTGTVTPETVGFSSASIPPPRFTEVSTPSAVELPRTLTIGGFLYQRVDMNLSADVTGNSDGHHHSGPNLGSMPLHQQQDRLTHLDGSYSHGRAPSDVQLDHRFARGEAQTTSPASNQQNIHEQNLSQAQLPVGEDEMTEVQRDCPEPESDSGPETLKPTTKPSSQQAPPKPKKMLRELEGYNESPEPDSDCEQEELRLQTARSSRRAPPESRRKSSMLREIEAHNLSPEPEVETLCDLKDDWRDAPVTRGARKDLENFVKGKPPTPRKNLNFKALMLAEFSGMEKGTKTFDSAASSNLGRPSYQKRQELRKEMDCLDREEDEVLGVAKNIKMDSRSHPQRISTRGITPRQVLSSTKDSEQNEKRAAKSTWSTWDNQKERIKELAVSPRYNPHPSPQEMEAQGRKKPAYHVTAEVPEGFEGAFHMEEGLYVFTPTATAFFNFPRFLKDVEEIAGRKMGVVKVIIPSGCLSEPPSASRRNLSISPDIKTLKVSMTLANDDGEDQSKVYHMLTTNESTSFEAEEWLCMIQMIKKKVINKRAISAEAISRNEVWKENYELKPYSERTMIRRSEKQNGALICALNEPATDILRAALKCRDPNIDNLLGNRFASSRSTQPGINESVFHIAGSPGPLSALQMNKYAAYSLNYHHSGAPRILNVILPEHHAKLEEVMYITQDSGNLSGRPRKPPACSQFVEHQQMYVPHATLSVHNIDYTKVVQHQGEMVIIFPYAYHQAYAAGPNITEEMLYASDRCKVFHREKLYQLCSRRCATEQPDDFDLKAVFSNTLSSPRSDRRYRSRLESPSTSTSPPQSPESNASQEGAADRRRSKRISGLKAMDRVSDDGDWVEGSNQASTFQPSTQRKTPRLTSNPSEPDIWDPAHTFGDSHDPAENDEGTPIGGIRPRDMVTGRLLTPHEWRLSKRHSDNSDDTPRKQSRRH